MVNFLLLSAPVFPVKALTLAFGDKVYDPGRLPPIDSSLKVAVGDPAPGFTLKAVSGNTISLDGYRQKKNVLLTFVPAAWTPVCSDQWPGYNIARPLFEQKDTVLLGITTDNIPTLYSWTREMGQLWFDVLSDFWPHGQTAGAYGVLRSDGTAERALILIDKKGVIRWIHVSDINIRPDLGMIIKALDRL
ncbi:MAG: peroxiredoxin [Desulfobacter sp.]|nr:MAG: peroxiredoxin [Desulfobacter sp.]